MKVNRPLILLVAALVGLGALGFWLFGWWRSDASQTIRVSGNIELTQVDIAFKVTGKLMERTVDEGAAVRRGMVIARLDQEQLRHQYERAQATLASAESRRIQLQTEIQYQSESVDGQIAQRKAEEDEAQATLRDLLAGSRTQEIEQARAAAARAATEKDKAEKDWERAQTLYKN